MATDTAKVLGSGNFTRLFESVRDTLPQGVGGWLGSFRDSGMERFAGGGGFPSTRQETWKFTNLTPLAEFPLAPPTTSAEAASHSDPAALLASLPPLEGCGHRLVFVNGIYRPDLSAPGSLPPGVTLMPMVQAIEAEPETLQQDLGRLAPPDGDAVAGLNAALMQDGFLLRLAPQAELLQSLHVVFLGQAGAPIAFHPRNLVIAGAGSRAHIVETHLGGGAEVYFTNPFTEILVGEGAVLGHYRYQGDSLSAFHLGRTLVDLARDAAYSSFCLNLGGRLVRHDIAATLSGPGSACRLDGAYLLTADQHNDTAIRMDHIAPHTDSQQTYKGVVEGKAHGVFQGRIAVAPHAQKISGHQLSRALLLSDQARVDAKPELEIFADDVKCSHGSTIGELDANALFYLRARGIDEKTAKNLLVAAFIEEVLTDIADSGTQEMFRHVVQNWMQTQHKAA